MTLMCIFFSHFFGAFLVCHYHAGKPIHNLSSLFWLREESIFQDFLINGPVQCPLNPMTSPCTLNRKSASKHNVSIMFDCGDVSLWVSVFLFLHT